MSYVTKYLKTRSKMKVKCSVEEEEIEREGGNGTTTGIVAVCTRCDHRTESFGTGEGSVKRCLALMREECPQDEENFYINEND